MSACFNNAPSRLYRGFRVKPAAQGVIILRYGLQLYVALTIRQAIDWIDERLTD